MEKSEHSVYVGKNKMSLGLLNGTAIWPWNKAPYAMFLGCLDFAQHKMASRSNSQSEASISSLELTRFILEVKLLVGTSSATFGTDRQTTKFASS